MRKIILVVFVLIFIFSIPVSASVMPSAYQTRTKVYIDSKTTIHCSQVKYHLTVRPGFTSVTTTMVVVNKSDVDTVDLSMSIPETLNNGYTINQLNVSSNNQNIKVYKRTAIGAPDTPDNIPYPKLYTWSIPLNPLEKRIITLTYNTETKKHSDGTLIVNIPLREFRVWNGDIGFMEIVADLDYYPAYSFYPNPTPMPERYDNNGQLTWYFYNETFPDYFDISFLPFTNIMNAFFASPTGSDAELTEIVQSFELGDYNKTLALTANYKVNYPETPYFNEIDFLRAYSCNALGLLEESLSTYDQLEQKQLFGSYASVVNNQIMYEKYNLLHHLGKHEEASLYIKSIDAKLSDVTSIFSMWVKTENTLINPKMVEVIATPTPLPTNEAKPATQSKTLVSFDLSAFLLTDVELFNFTFPMYFCVISLAIVLVLIFVLISSSKPKRKYTQKRSYRR